MPRLLCEGNELVGRYQSLFRMAPPDQSFRTAYFEGPAIDDRLEVNLKVVIHQRMTQLIFEDMFVGSGAAQRRVKGRVSVSTQRFGVVERKIGHF